MQQLCKILGSILSMHVAFEAPIPSMKNIRDLALLLLIHCLLSFPLFVGFCVWSIFCNAVYLRSFQVLQPSS